ncbi:MAG: Flp pilus assembly protein CpaB [Planctomycetales bacterium]|nr:Flp pilus assembly protein CpaB [Planctomycetales bacterium]
MSVGVLAIFSGLLGAYGLRAILLAEPTPPPARPAMVTLPLATVDLPEGRRITLGDIAIHRMSPQEQAKRGFLDPAVMLTPDQIIGRTLSAPVKQGQAFLTTSMYLEGVGPNVAERLKPGFRAVNVEVSRKLGGTTPPGTFVDVLFRSSPRPANDSVRAEAIPETTVTLFEAVEVIGFEQGRSAAARSNNLDIRYINGRTPGGETSPMITLAVTLEQANVLRTVEGRGELALIPRALDDLASSTGSTIQPLTLENLLGVEPRRSFATEIYRGGSRSVRVFNDGEIERAYQPMDDPAATGAVQPATDL